MPGSIKKLPEGWHSAGDGLYMRVQGSARSWCLRVQVGGKRIVKKLGSWPGLNEMAARERAVMLRSQLQSGIVPKAPPKEAPRLEDMWEEAVENQRRVKAWTNEKAITQWTTTLQTYILPALGGKRVDEITRDDVLEVLSPMWLEKPATAAKVRGRLETILDYCKAKGWRYGENPAAWRGNLALFLPSRFAAAPVEHFDAVDLDTLKSNLVPVLWERGTPASLAILFGCLTALRAGEFLRARWEEINGDVFEVPWTRMKTAKRSRESFRVPLSRQALAVLERVRGLDEDIVFPGRIGKYLALDTPRLTIQRLTGSGATMHGMRSVFRDWSARKGVPFATAEKCLSHAVGDRTVQAYLRNDLLEERRKVMQAWADEIFPLP